MSEPSLTLAVPTYNRAGHVRRLVNCMAPAIEAGKIRALVVDDGSSDSTLDALGALQSAPDLRLVRNEANRGYARTLLRIFEECETDYVMVVADDDDLEPDEFASLIRWLGDVQPDFASTQWLRGTELYRGSTETRLIRPLEYHSCAAHASGLVWRISALQRPLSILKSRLEERSEIAETYPQLVLVTSLFAAGAEMWWWARSPAREGESPAPSGIVGMTGTHYSHPTSRLLQQTSMMMHLRSLEALEGSAAAMEMFRSHRKELYPSVREHLCGLASEEVAAALDASAKRFLFVKTIPSGIRGRLRRVLRSS